MRVVRVKTFGAAVGLLLAAMLGLLAVPIGPVDIRDAELVVAREHVLTAGVPTQGRKW